MAQLKFRGMSAYAGMHDKFPVRRFLRQYPDNIAYPGTALLCGCFGWNMQLVKLFCDRFSTVPHCLEFHISNGASRRSGRLGPGAYAKDMNAKDFNKAWETGGTKELELQLNRFLKKIMDADALFMNMYTHVVICPELEDNLSDKAFKNFLKMIKSSVGVVGEQYEYVRSPCTGGSAVPKRCMVEVHGKTMPVGDWQIGNLDGTSVDFQDGEKYFNQCSMDYANKYLHESTGYMTLLWSALQQGVGNESGWGNWPPHKLRKFIVTDNAIRYGRSILYA